MARTPDDGSRLAKAISGVIVCLAVPLGVGYLFLGLGAIWLGVLYMPVTVLVGCVLGLVLPVRQRWLLAPVCVLVLAVWADGWVGDTGDIGRAGAVVFSGVLGAMLFVSWFVGVRIGRRFRRHRTAQARSNR